MTEQIAPRRFAWVKQYRAWLERVWPFPIPNISPDLVSIAAVIVSFFVVPILTEHRLWAIALVVLILWLDWLDGVIARRYQRSSAHGWLVDIGADRIQEAIIFFSLGGFWVVIWIVNAILSLLGIVQKKSMTLPARFLFLITLLLGLEVGIGQTLLSSFWFFLPLGIANMMPIFAAKLWPRLSWPLDFGAYFHGKPFLGSHKTYRGVLTGVLGGLFTFWIQQELYLRFEGVRDISLFDYSAMSVYFGALLGLGALAGDALKSFFKRRVNIPPGHSWFPFDQIDYSIGGLAFGAFAFFPGMQSAIVILLLGFGLHLFITWIGENIGLR